MFVLGSFFILIETDTNTGIGLDIEPTVAANGLSTYFPVASTVLVISLRVGQCKQANNMETT